VIFPAITGTQIVVIMASCATTAVAAGGWLLVRGRLSRAPAVLGDTVVGDTVGGDISGADAVADRMTWRMPPLSELPTPKITGARRVGLIGLRGYLAIALIMVIVKVILLAVAH
jgi:hypothetical protein